MAWIYVLHFDAPLSHARHYTGCTNHLPHRLLAHARGAGARLTRVLLDKQIPWQLAAAYRVSNTEMRTCERKIKDQHHGPRFCPLCQGENTATIPGQIQATPYDLSLLSTWQSSTLIARYHNITPPDFNIQRTTKPLINQKRDRAWLKCAMACEGDALGFVPISNKADNGFEFAWNTGKILISYQDGNPAAYLLYSGTSLRLRVHQIYTQDDCRLFGHASRLLQHLQNDYPTMPITAWVKDYLTANQFWINRGFRITATKQHKTSGNTLNHYERTPRKRQP